MTVTNIAIHLKRNASSRKLAKLLARKYNVEPSRIINRASEIKARIINKPSKRARFLSYSKSVS